MKLKVSGGKSLRGVVEIGGAKNSAVAIIPAAILCDGEVILENVPDIVDCDTLYDILRFIGFEVIKKYSQVIIRKQKKISYNLITPEVTKLRGSYYFIGSLLGLKGKIKTFYPGGCNLGNRPIDFHLDAFSKMGAKIKVKKDIIKLKTKKLTGTVINLPFPSVGATINILLAAAKAKGITTINNCALEPEVNDVANFLVSMGAKITGIGSSSLIISGVKKLHSTQYKIMPDRIEAGTYMIIGALSEKNNITIKNIVYEHNYELIKLLTEIGVNIDYINEEVKVKRSKELKPFMIITRPYPGFPTDLQQPLTVLMTQIVGTSIIKETVFKNRFSQIEFLNKMGADITVDNGNIIVTGKTSLTANKLIGSDLRGAAALVMASTIAEGESIIDNIEVFLRGYEKPIQKLSSLGLKCELIE